MARLTIAQRRERQLQSFNEEFIKDISKASYIINSFYRLCGLDEWLLYAENDPRRCNSRYTQEQEEKALRWIARLNKHLAPYGLKIAYSGYLPSICIMGEGNRIDRVVYSGIFYN